MPETADPRRPPPWDTARMEILRCDVATATASAAAGEVAVHFGQREPRDDGQTGVRLARSFALSPYSAKRLQELLAVLLREHDRRQGAPLPPR